MTYIEGQEWFKPCKRVNYQLDLIFMHPSLVKLLYSYHVADVLTIITVIHVVCINKNGIKLPLFQKRIASTILSAECKLNNLEYWLSSQEKLVVIRVITLVLERHESSSCNKGVAKPDNVVHVSFSRW